MKILIFCIGLFSAAGCTLLTSTTEAEVFATIVIDRTDELTVHPDARAICTDLGLINHPYQGVSVTVTSVTDMNITPEKVITLEGEQEWQGNIHVRQSKIAAFTDTLAQTIAGFLPTDSTKMRRSVLFYILSNQLTALSQKQGKKLLYLYSDLSENSDFLNTYQPSILEDIKRHPDKYVKLLEQEYPLPDLKGITVYCMYNPSSQTADYRYTILSSLVRLWLENHHTSVIMKASH